MDKIKPRKGWYEYSPPRKPCKPTPPEKEYSTFEETEISFLGSSDSVRIGDLKLPEDCSIEDLIVITDFDHDDEGGGSSHHTSIIHRIEKLVPNPLYEKQLKKYEKNLTNWEEKMKSHRVEVKEWKAWVEQEKNSRLEANLAHAEELLKKHGRLK
jgi:hypothetical protein